VKVSLNEYNDFACSKDCENIVFKIKKELIMKNHYKVFLRYCLAMIIMVIMGEVINYYFQKKVNEHTLSWFIAAFVWVILGGLILTFVDGRTRKKKSIR